MTTTRIPKIFAEPYTGYVPLASAFTKQPAESIEADDFILVSGVIYRVAGARHYKTSIYLTLTLHPVAGGRIYSRVYARRNWIPVYRGR